MTDVTSLAPPELRLGRVLVVSPHLDEGVLGIAVLSTVFVSAAAGRTSSSW